MHPGPIQMHDNGHKFQMTYSLAWLRGCNVGGRIPLSIQHLRQSSLFSPLYRLGSRELSLNRLVKGFEMNSPPAYP
jgi:hypothetical protein